MNALEMWIYRRMFKIKILYTDKINLKEVIKRTMIEPYLNIEIPPNEKMPVFRPKLSAQLSTNNIENMRPKIKQVCIPDMQIGLSGTTFNFEQTVYELSRKVSEELDIEEKKHLEEGKMGLTFNLFSLMH